MKRRGEGPVAQHALHKIRQPGAAMTMIGKNDG